ncbi:hypothetical protein [Candidatus Poriferisodalis sp.]|uniref:hypothetical protein n=1 Tax=Candidatus Poriferisodalis sp. TaxID=3101277 RepID=UPI003C6F2BC2
MAAPVIGTAGLVLGVVGVILLYITTSQNKIEAELSYKIVREFTEPDGESLHPFTRDEHERRLERSRRRIASNDRRRQFGLGLVALGIIAQGVALWL